MQNPTIFFSCSSLYSYGIAIDFHSVCACTCNLCIRFQIFIHVSVIPVCMGRVIQRKLIVDKHNHDTSQHNSFFLSYASFKF